MALWLVIGFDRHPHKMVLRDTVRPAHRAYVLGHAEKLRMAGAMVDEAQNQQGTLLVFEAETEQEVWDWVRAEPFYQAGVYETLAIRKWDLVIGAIAKPAG